MPLNGNDRIKVSYSDLWKVGENFTIMIIKLEQNNKISLPEEIMESLHLHSGQELDIRIEDGQIIICPAEMIEQMKAVKEELEYMKQHPEEYKSYSDVDEMFKDLKVDVND